MLGESINEEWQARLPLAVAGVLSNTSDVSGRVRFDRVSVQAAQGSIVSLRIECNFQGHPVASMTAGTVVVGAVSQRWLRPEAKLDARAGLDIDETTPGIVASGQRGRIASSNGVLLAANYSQQGLLAAS